MKILPLLLALLFSVNAFAALPLQGKGQGETSYAEINKLTVGNKLMTRVSATEVNIETGNFNILDNPSFNAPVVSNATQGWTVTATGTATCTIATSTSSPMDGEKQYLVLTGLGGASGGTCSLKQSPTTSKRANAIVGFSYLPDPLGSCPGGNPTLTVRTLVNGTATTSQDGTNCGTSSTWQSFYVNEVTGSTSTGVEVLLTIPASTSSNFGIDRARVAPGDYTAPSVETQSYIANLTSGNAQNTLISSKGSGLFSVSTVSSKIRFTALKRVSMVVEGTSSYSSTAPTSCGAEVLFNGNHISGEQNFIASGGSNNQQCAAGGTSILDPGDYMEYDSYVYSGGTFSNGWVSVTAVSASQVQVLSSQCGANCETSLTANVTGATGAISAQKIPGALSSSRSATGVYTINYTGLTVVPAITFDTSSPCTQSYISTAATSSAVGITTRNNSGVNADCDFTVTVDKQGADYISSRTIVGSFKEVMTAPGVTKPKTCVGSYGGTGSLASPTNCTASPCTEYVDTCGTLSTTRSTTGTYSIVAAAGTFAASSFVECDFSPSNGSNGLLIQYPPVTLASDASGGFTYGNVATQISGGAVTDTRFNIKCFGVAP